MKNIKKSFETSSWTEVYSQEEDSSSGRKDDYGNLVKEQELSLAAIDASSNDHYIVIETERWAIDINEIDDFAKLLKDFINKEVKPKAKKTK
jgi:hypothetical protein